MSSMNAKPVPVESSRFSFRAQALSCRNLRIKNKITGKTFEVDWGDVEEFLQGLNATCGVK